MTYTAPASVPVPATVTLTATSVADATKFVAAGITVTAGSPISVSLTPKRGGLALIYALVGFVPLLLSEIRQMMKINGVDPLTEEAGPLTHVFDTDARASWLAPAW